MLKKKKRQLNQVLGAVLSLFLCLSFPAQASEKIELIRSQIIKLANQERDDLGFEKLTESQALNQAAGLKLEDMFENDYFSHTSPTGVDPWYWFGQAGYNYQYAGENLAMDFTSADSVHRAWMKSPTHKENIVSEKFSQIGVAVAEGTLDGRKTFLAVQLFGHQDGRQQDFLKNTLLNVEEEKISIQESSVFPWKNSSGQNEALISAEVIGPVDDVSAVIKEKNFPLEKIRENTYLSLVSLEDWSFQEDQVVIKARSLSGWEVSELVLPTKYFGYFQQAREEQKETQKEIMSKQVTAAGQTAELSKGEFFSVKKIQDGMLVFGALVFLLTIGNIWILEKEEEKLLLAKCSV